MVINTDKKRHAENSLGHLAVQFIKIASHSANNDVELHKASQLMQVRKRRIYDVTNVLEGLGLFKKTAKNRVGWIAEGNIRDLQMFHLPSDPNDPRGLYTEHIDEPYFFYDDAVIEFMKENDMSETGFQ